MTGMVVGTSALQLPRCDAVLCGERDREFEGVENTRTGFFEHETVRGGENTRTVRAGTRLTCRGETGSP